MKIDRRASVACKAVGMLKLMRDKNEGMVTGEGSEDTCDRPWLVRKKVAEGKASHEF